LVEAYQTAGGYNNRLPIGRLQRVCSTHLHDSYNTCHNVNGIYERYICLCDDQTSHPSDQ